MVKKDVERTTIAYTFVFCKYFAVKIYIDLAGKLNKAYGLT